ncbi:hypothetical protein BASA81_009884 [Batrachochytrium salamandrivorans]|nr:hypothetical protein BASA81_009884 [Batrachochytrium salamandrivorans]
MKLFLLAMVVILSGGFASPCQDDKSVVSIIQQGRNKLATSSVAHFIPIETAHYFVISPTPYVKIQILQGPSCDFPLNLFRESGGWNPYFSGMDSVLLVQGELYTVQVGPGKHTVEVYIGTNYAWHVISTDARLQGLISALSVFSALTMATLYTVWSEQEKFTPLEFWTLVNYLLVYALASTIWALPWCFPLGVLTSVLSYRDLEGLSSSSSTGTEHATMVCASVVNVVIAMSSLAVVVSHMLQVGEQCGTAACQVQMWTTPTVGLVSLLVQLFLLPVHLERQLYYCHPQPREQELIIALLGPKINGDNSLA